MLLTEVLRTVGNLAADIQPNNEQAHLWARGGAQRRDASSILMKASAFLYR